MNKILGIVLAVAMIAGLFVFAVPASAGDLSWDQVTVPSATATKLQITTNTNLNLLAFAADGKTAFTYDITGSKLYKSGDAGITWTNTNLGNGLPTGIIAIAVSPNYATDTTLIATNGATLYRSRNGGSSFQTITGAIGVGSPATSTITSINSIDIAPYYISTGGTAMLVGGPDGINLYNEDDGWTMVANTSTVGFVGGTILTAKFSPNYQNDGEILTVVTDVTHRRYRIDR